MTWAAGREPDKKKSGGDDVGATKNGSGEAQSDAPGDEDARVERPPVPADREEPLVADRPDFTEASSTVGKGRVQLEAGYTFATDRSGGVTTTSHSYPEALLRVGLFADWFEFRIGQNFGTLRTGPPGTPSASLPVAPTDTSSDPSPCQG